MRFRFDDAISSDAAETVAALNRQGYGVPLLSGDRTGVVERTARARASIWRAELKPAGKIAWLDRRAAEGRKVLMVGDGLNDAPALAAAHVSMSPATAADISHARRISFPGRNLRLSSTRSIPASEPGRWRCRISAWPRL